MRWGVVVVAAGRGTRFGGPKQFVDIAGRPMLAWSVATFGSMPEVVELVIATEPEFVEQAEKIAVEFAPRLVSKVVAGGETRQDSARRAVDALTGRCSAILIHDGARPLVTTHDVRACMREVRDGRGALLATPAVDTMKVVEPATGKVLRTLDRAELWSAETPQCGMAKDVRRAHHDAARHGTSATDDATLLERAGLDVFVVRGASPNFKVTRPEDRERAALILQQRPTRLASEEEILLVEAFVGDPAAEPVARELESRRGRVDAIDRDLPSAVVVRAYVPAEELRGFGERFAAIAGNDAIFTTHHAHVAVRPPRGE